MRQDISTIVEKTMEGQKTVPGVEHPVRCVFYDMRPYNYEEKLMFIKGSAGEDGKLTSEYYDSKKYKRRIGFSWSQYDEANLVASVLEKTEGEIAD